MRDIGKNIKEARIRRGLTQDELAERLHVSRQTVSNYETGRSRPDIDMLLSMAEQLEVDIQALLYGRPLEPEKRRERRFLLAESAALAGFGGMLFTLERWAHQFQGRFFIIAPRRLVLITAVPLFWLLLGWVLVHGSGVFLGAKLPVRGWTRGLGWAALGFLAFWAVLQAPAAAEAVRQIVYVLGRGSGAGYVGGAALPRPWERLSFWTLYWAGARVPAVFALCGGALRCAWGKGRKA